MIPHCPQHRQLGLYNSHRTSLAANRRLQGPIFTLVRKNQILGTLLKVVAAIGTASPGKNIDICCLQARNPFVDSEMVTRIAALVGHTRIGLLEIGRWIFDTFYRPHKYDIGGTEPRTRLRHRPPAAAGPGAPANCQPEWERKREANHRGCHGPSE